MSHKSLQFFLFALSVMLSPLIASAAGTSLNNELNSKENPAVGLSVTKELFGTMPDGTQVDKYTLTNMHGVKVGILTYGGIVQSIDVPDKNGKLGDIALGFDRLDDYIKSSPYFGAIIGRYGNRIAKGQFTLDGRQYQIPVNNGPNALHGGTTGFDKEVWSATPIQGSSWVGV